MQSLLSVLQINETLVYFVYGQVFFSLGLAIAFHSRRHSQLDLARQLSWLAAFGFAHGLNEWAHVFIPIQATYLPPESIVLLNSARIVLLALSFFFLGQFGVQVAVSRPRFRLAGRLLFSALLMVWVVWSFMAASSLNLSVLDGGEVWVRRLMGASASALAAFGMWRQADWVRRAGLATIARDFRTAAVFFGAYAVLAGLVVTSQLHSGDLGILYLLGADFLGLPVVVLRSLAVLGVAFGIIRGLGIFEIETDRRLEAAERARLAASERARKAMEEMAAAISEHNDPQRLFEAALEQVSTLSGSAAGWMMLAEADSGKVGLWAGRGLGGAIVPATKCAEEKGCACQIALSEARSVVLPSDPRCRLSNGSSAAARWASIPLVAHSRSVGVMRLVDGDFGPEMLALLESLGKQLGLAVENAELERQVAHKEASRAQLLRKVITAQEEERRRVARELHDQTGQSLTAVIMALGVVRERMGRGPKRVGAMVDEAREVAVGALESTRGLIMGLRPASLDDLGLLPTLRRFAEDLSRNESLCIAIESSGLTRRLPGEVEILLFRILQESLNNVARHSQAHQATVRLASDSAEVRAEVVDDGLGFDLAEATAHPSSGRGLGLLGMKERAGLLGGEVQLETAPGRGTRVLVQIPLQEDVESGTVAGADRR